MAWGDKKTTRDDTNHMRPQKLSPDGYANPEQRAMDKAKAAVNGDSLHMVAFDIQNDLDAAELRRKQDAHDEEQRRMEALEKEMKKPRIEQIMDIVSALTYGEMMGLAEAWAEVMPSGTVDKDSFKLILPPTLHAWTTS